MHFKATKQNLTTIHTNLGGDRATPNILMMLGCFSVKIILASSKNCIKNFPSLVLVRALIATLCYNICKIHITQNKHRYNSNMHGGDHELQVYDDNQDTNSIANPETSLYQNP